MNKIVRKEQFSEKVFLFEIEAPLIAKSRKAGNFVIVRVDQKGERMPLTIAAADIEKGTITLVVQMVGLSSKKLCALNEGEYIADVVGPLGNPTHIENFGTVVCAGGGLGGGSTDWRSDNRSGLFFHFHFIFGSVHIDGGNVALNVLDFNFIWFTTNGEFECFHSCNN